MNPDYSATAAAPAATNQFGAAANLFGTDTLMMFMDILFPNS